MSKKIKNFKWESVALEGFPAALMDKFQGFVGLEECTDYGLDKTSKRSKKNKQQKKRKNNENINPQTEKPEVPQKKIKLTNGFTVETCRNTAPSLTNLGEKDKKRPKNNKKKSKIIDNDKTTIKSKNTESKSVKKVKKTKLGENLEVNSDLTPEDMLSWAEFKLPEDILKALMELGFKKPTQIQQLSLPAAIHGRRDILGAAETGSGKTLAFGLPILSGIMKLKEKASAKGLDVYEIPYRKSVGKKKNIIEETKQSKNKKRNVKSKKEVIKEHSEQDFSSSDEESDLKPKENDNSAISDDFIEEIEVPLKKSSIDNNDSNDSDDENCIHLSEILDSDDLKSSDDEGSIDNGDGAMNDNDKGVDEVDQNEQGIGCVKVVDNIEIPGQVIVKTGKPLYALIITPTRELAIQISRHLIAVAKYTGIKIATIVGGMAAVKQERVLKSGPEIVVATPGRLWELIGQGQTHLQQLPAVKFLAIDETDRMIERGHFEELEPLLERLNSEETHKNARQNFVFSATLTMVHDLPAHMKGKKVTKRGKIINRKIEKMTPQQKIKKLINKIGMTDPKVVDITTQNLGTAETLTESRIVCALNEKDAYLYYILKRHPGRTIVFCNSIGSVTKRGKIINRKIEKMTPQQKIKKLINKIGMTDPKVVDITTQNLGTAETLTESRIVCALNEKDAYLYYILKRHPGRTIVFCNSIGSVRRLAQLLTLLKCQPLPLHASMPQRQRLKNLERFRDDPNGVLVATDVAARGLDIPNVDHVVHYQVPKTAENYVHRSGRTARATKEGLTILMMEPSEAYSYAKLCRTLNKTSEIPTFPIPSYSIVPIKELMTIARDIDGLLLKKRRNAQAQGWRDRVAKEMDMIVDDDDVPAAQSDPTIDKALKAKKRQLESMLSRPLFPKGFSFKYPTLNDPNALQVMSEENALQVMKNALESGKLKKEKRQGKNDSLLKLGKNFKRSTKKKI